MDYDKQSLSIINVDGSLSRFTNGASGQVLLGTGSGVLPTWGTLSSVATGLSDGIARLSNGFLVSDAIGLGGTDVAGILPVTKGGTGIGTSGISGILIGNGTGPFTAVSTSGVNTGDVLAKTANGYAFITLGSATVPPIIDLQSGATSEQEGYFLKVNSDLEPEWASVSSITGDYLPLAGGAMNNPSVLSAWVVENSGWFTGMTHGFWDGTNRNANAKSTTFRVMTKIGTWGEVFGDYIIRIHGYNADDSSETVDYIVYLTNADPTTNQPGQHLTDVRGFRNKGSLTPTTFKAYGHDAENNCLSLQFTFGNVQKNLVLAVDFVTHDLARASIVNSSTTDYEVATGWYLRADAADAGSTGEINVLSRYISDLIPLTSLPSSAGAGDVGKILSVSQDSPYNAEWINTLSVAHGGTGLSSVGTAGYALVSNGSGFEFAPPTTTKKTFTFNSNGWWRIAEQSASDVSNIGKFKFYRDSNGTCKICIFNATIDYNASVHPQITQDIFSGGSDDIVRILHSSTNANKAYLEIYISNVSGATLYFEQWGNWNFVSETTKTASIPSGYTDFEYKFSEDAYGTAGQILATNSTGNGREWVSKVPAAVTADSLTGNITSIASGSTNEGYLLSVGASPNYTPTWVEPTSIEKSYKIPQTGWYRIASMNVTSSAYGNFVAKISSTVCVEFSVVESLTQSPQISIKNYTTRGYSGGNIDKIRTVYISSNGGDFYIDVHFICTSTTTATVRVYNYNHFDLKEPESTNESEASVPEGYLSYVVQLSMNEFGQNGQFLRTNKSVEGNITTYSQSWVTLPTIPSAPSSLPLVDNETGAIGTAGVYATATHQHPLPYSVPTAKRFFYPRKIGIGGILTAEAQVYDGSDDLILIVTQIDPNGIINAVPIAKGGTGATTASAALTNLGAAAATHNHDSTYLKLSGNETMTGGITFGTSITPITWTGKNGVAVFNSSGELITQDSVNAFVTGRRNVITLYDSGVSSDSSSPTTINHVAKNDTTVNIVCGINEVRSYTRYINLPTPTSDMLGDTITVYFTNQKPSVIGNLFAMCSTNYRIKAFDYSNFGNTEGVDTNCKWSSGNVVQFTCINLENNGTTYYWRAVKMVEQTW